MLKLEIVTPEKRVFDAEVDSVTVPTTTGEAGILPNHAPLISALKPGILSYSVKGVSEKFAVAGGFVEVNANKVAVLADTAETAEEIDLNAAKSDRENAEKTLSAAASGSIEDNEAVREQLAAANVRILLASGK
ncbi:MAG: F0F1 ATP synthase subunit epsilon [Pyrinomonadaceae bacterium]|nr:F0F1 ATP synthase subunit epsilon [Pyrinomonadaceae bacterium]